MFRTTLAFVLFSAPLAAQSTLFVDDDFTPATPGWNVDHFSAIQDALDASTAGDRKSVV